MYQSIDVEDLVGKGRVVLTYGFEPVYCLVGEVVLFAILFQIADEFWEYGFEVLEGGCCERHDCGPSPFSTGL